MTKKLGYGLLGFIFLLSLLHLFSIFKPKSELESLDEAFSQLVAPATIDALNDITKIPSLQSGIIKNIFVKVGQKVQKGDLLFELDQTVAKNHLKIEQIRLKEAQNAYTLQQKQLAHLQKQLEIFKSLDKRSISETALQEKIFAVELNQLQLNNTKEALALTKASLKEHQLLLEQYQVKAPKDGVVLQINSRKNEFVGTAQPILLLGDAQKSMVRVSIDEKDIKRFNSGGKAYMTSPEDPTLRIPLTFYQMQRYIITSERLNSRVQEVLYYFDRNKYPDMVAGQQCDVTIAIKKART